jgi:hypothetical protein
MNCFEACDVSWECGRIKLKWIFGNWIVRVTLNKEAFEMEVSDGLF